MEFVLVFPIGQNQMFKTTLKASIFQIVLLIRALNALRMFQLRRPLKFTIIDVKFEQL